MWNSSDSVLFLFIQYYMKIYAIKSHLKVCKDFTSIISLISLISTLVYRFSVLPGVELICQKYWAEWAFFRDVWCFGKKELFQFCCLRLKKDNLFTLISAVLSGSSNSLSGYLYTKNPLGWEIIKLESENCLFGRLLSLSSGVINRVKNICSALLKCIKASFRSSHQRCSVKKVFLET